MSAITRIRAWSNPGFTEDGPEAPHYGYTLPTASQDLQNLDYEPSTSRIFSEFKIAGAVWESWRGMSFLEVTYTWNNSLSDTVLYGFVDEVELLSDTAGAAAVRVRWHVDEWMTYLSSATLGAGHVLRRPFVGESTTPIQGYERKFWELDSTTNLYDTWSLSSKRTWWVLLAVGCTVNTDKLVRYYSFPFVIDNTQIFGKVGGIGVSFPTYKDIVSGSWDEALGIDPDNVYGAWVVPFPPMDPTDIDTTDPIGISISSTAWAIVQESAGLCATFLSDVKPAYNLLFHQRTKTMTSKTSTQLNPLVINGFSGEKFLDIPVGMSVGTHTYRIVASATECYIEIRFSDWSSKLIGVCATVPAPVLDMTSNAWSSYQYSGQRDYDIVMRNNESIRSGVDKIASGAAQGFILGGFNPAGAGLSAAAGAVGGAISLATDMLWFNEASQNEKDKLAARQAASILISGGALDTVLRGHDLVLCTMEMDSYSAGRVSDERSLVGVRVDEYNSTNDTVRASTGFYQIANLAVTGAIPNSAKRTIANRFAKGVRLI